MVQHNDGRRVSARAIILRDNKLLVFKRKRFDVEEGSFLEYYSIPGGGVEMGESIEDACVRELKEEMGIDIKLLQKVAVRYANRHENHMYVAEIVSGEPYFVPDSEEARAQNPFNQFEVRWVPVDELTVENMLFYSHFLPIIKAYAQGKLPSEPIELKDD